MKITDYQFGSIEIDGQRYGSDVIVAADTVMDNWWREQGHNLAIGDLDAVLEAAPEVLVVGSGYHGRMQVPDATRTFLEARGIEIRVAPTRDAVKLFNELQEHCARVVAALHLTC